MKALVLGGTGAIGKELIGMLAEKGWSVSVTSRTPGQAPGQLNFIHGNAQDMGFMREVLDKKWDVIIDFMVYSTQAFRERVDLLLQNTGQYIFLSSARIYAQSDSPITEDSPRLLDVCDDSDFLATEEYALAKARQEDQLLGSTLSNWTIIRPYISYGPTRLQLGILEKEEWLYRALHARKVVVSAEINSRLTTLTHGQDVARGISALAGNGAARGEIFQITHATPIRWGDVLQIYLNVLSQGYGLAPEVIETDSPTFQSIIPRPYQIKYDRLYNRVFDSSKIRELTGLQTFINPDEGIRVSLLQFMENARFLQISWPLEARKDTFTKEQAGFDEMEGMRAYAKYLAWRYLRPIKTLIKSGKTL